MQNLTAAVGASLLANLQSPVPSVREQGLRRPPRAYQKNKSLMETAV